MSLLVLECSENIPKERSNNACKILKWNVPVKQTNKKKKTLDVSIMGTLAKRYIFVSYDHNC